MTATESQRIFSPLPLSLGRFGRFGHRSQEKIRAPRAGASPHAEVKLTGNENPGHEFLDAVGRMGGGFARGLEPGERTDAIRLRLGATMNEAMRLHAAAFHLFSGPVHVEGPADGRLLRGPSPALHDHHVKGVVVMKG